VLTHFKACVVSEISTCVATRGRSEGRGWSCEWKVGLMFNEAVNTARECRECRTWAETYGHLSEVKSRPTTSASVRILGMERRGRGVDREEKGGESREIIRSICE
jgi:hypothetical protein